VRRAIGRAAKHGKTDSGKGWFKNVTLGEQLGGVVGRATAPLAGTPTANVIGQLMAWIYGLASWRRTWRRLSAGWSSPPLAAVRRISFQRRSGARKEDSSCSPTLMPGVKAIRERMLRLGVAPELYRVATIDAFALKYASAFPGLSAWTVPEPEGAQWAALRPAALLACRAPPVIDVLRASYAGIYVDEYQDLHRGPTCLGDAAGVAAALRILGDPLQANLPQDQQGRGPRVANRPGTVCRVGNAHSATALVGAE